jgi:hypothetical protein
VITQEERESIVQEAVERTLRFLPGVVSNLMVSKEVYDKMTEKFYSDNPEFKQFKPIVAEVVSKIEGKDPTKTYEQILREATPEIKKAIELRQKVSMDLVERKDVNLEFESTPKVNPDVDYGEI